MELRELMSGLVLGVVGRAAYLTAVMPVSAHLPDLLSVWGRGRGTRSRKGRRRRRWRKGDGRRSSPREGGSAIASGITRYTNALPVAISRHAAFASTESYAAPRVLRNSDQDSLLEGRMCGVSPRWTRISLDLSAAKGEAPVLISNLAGPRTPPLWKGVIVGIAGRRPPGLASPLRAQQKFRAKS